MGCCGLETLKWQIIDMQVLMAKPSLHCGYAVFTYVWTWATSVLTHLGRKPLFAEEARLHLCSQASRFCFAVYTRVCRCLYGQQRGAQRETRAMAC